MQQVYSAILSQLGDLHSNALGSVPSGDPHVLHQLKCLHLQRCLPRYLVFRALWTRDLPSQRYVRAVQHDSIHGLSVRNNHSQNQLRPHPALGHPYHFNLPSHCNRSNLLLPGPMLYALVRMPAFKVKNKVGRRFAAKDFHRRV